MAPSWFFLSSTYSIRATKTRTGSDEEKKKPSAEEEVGAGRRRKRKEEGEEGGGGEGGRRGGGGKGRKRTGRKRNIKRINEVQLQPRMIMVTKPNATPAAYEGE